MDYARWVFAYRLRGDSPEDFRRRGDKVDVNLGLFRRHIPRRGAFGCHFDGFKGCNGSCRGWRSSCQSSRNGWELRDTSKGATSH